MKAHCSTCLSTDPENTDVYDAPGLQGYSACCDDRVCDGFAYDVRLSPNGQEIMGWDAPKPGQLQVRACCVHIARRLLDIR